MDDHPKKAESAIGEVSLVRRAGIIALAASLAVGHTVFAAPDSEEDAPTTAAEVTEGGPSGDAESAEERVERRIEEWRKGPGRALYEREDLNTVSGTSLAVLRTDDKRWSKARSLAFQNAFVQAMGKYVASVRQRTAVSLMRDYFADDIPESELVYQEGEAPDSYVERVVLKAAALAEHELDRRLAESGLNDDEIQRMTPVQKRTAFKESISRKTLTEAIGSAAGLIPVKTFEELDDEGNSAIGVVAVYSERMRLLANRISRGEVIRPEPGRAGSPISDQIADFEEDELPYEFGVRVMWDEQGYPAIVSFGQWGWSPSKLSKRKRAVRRKFTRKQAENDARANLTVFINACTRFTEESNVGADLEEAFDLPRGGIPEEIDSAGIVDKLVEAARVKAKVILTGYTQERSWSAPHPLLEEQQIVGTVAYWSPAREDAIRKTIGKKAKHAPPEKAPRKRAEGYVEGGGQSREPDLADF